MFLQPANFHSRWQPPVVAPSPRPFHKSETMLYHIVTSARNTNWVNSEVNKFSLGMSPSVLSLTSLSLFHVRRLSGLRYIVGELRCVAAPTCVCHQSLLCRIVLDDAMAFYR